MKLSHEDATLFFDLMWALQYFAKEQLNMLPEITSLEEYRNSSSEDKLAVRKPLFEQRDLIDAFVAENPQHLSKEHLAIVQSWKDAILGDFYIERMLKRYTIFVATDENVYAVLGLYDAFDEIIHKSRIPMLVRTILLPFKGQIIYDGLLQGNNMYFGGGIKRNLKEDYLAAKQNDRIIESLGEPAGSSTQSKRKQPQKNWKAEFKTLTANAKKLRGSSDQPAINSPTFGMIKASIEFGQLATAEQGDVEQLWESFEKIERAMRKLGNTLNRME